MGDKRQLNQKKKKSNSWNHRKKNGRKKRFFFSRARNANSARRAAKLSYRDCRVESTRGVVARVRVHHQEARDTPPKIRKRGPEQRRRDAAHQNAADVVGGRVAVGRVRAREQRERDSQKQKTHRSRYFCFSCGTFVAVSRRRAAAPLRRGCRFFRKGTPLIRAESIVRLARVPPRQLVPARLAEPGIPQRVYKRDAQCARSATADGGRHRANPSVECHNPVPCQRQQSAADAVRRARRSAHLEVARAARAAPCRARPAPRRRSPPIRRVRSSLSSTSHLKIEKLTVKRRTSRARRARGVQTRSV